MWEPQGLKRLLILRLLRQRFHILRKNAPLERNVRAPRATPSPSLPQPAKAQTFFSLRRE
jgi:hypothetical protein